MRWKFTNASVTGKAHTSRGENGQDSCRAGTVRMSDADFFIGIAADGAGSATEGGRGADIACQTLYARINHALGESGDLSRITDDEISNWVTVSRDAIVTDAQESGKRLREYASTVIVTVAGNGHAIFFQIGDGAIVTGTGPDYQTIFWPEQGEYANTTFFLSPMNITSTTCIFSTQNHRTKLRYLPMACRILSSRLPRRKPMPVFSGHSLKH